jgi:hypothetical protein
MMPDSTNQLACVGGLNFTAGAGNFSGFQREGDRKFTEHERVLGRARIAAGVQPPRRKCMLLILAACTSE